MLSNFVLLAVSFTTFLCCVSSCDFYCPDKPVLTPSRLVVKYDDPASATCVACQQACLPLEQSVISMEASLGNTVENGATVTWKLDRMTEWDLTPKCYYTDKNDKQCCTNLAVTVYQPPEGVSISLNHAGPLTDGTDYILQCSVLNVAPVKNLNVTFYRGQTPLGHMRSNNTTKTPISESFTLSYTASKEDNGAQFWCKVKLELGSEGPQLPPVVRSENLTATVYYGPELNVPADPVPVYFTKGETLHLNCLAEGNPNPSYIWTLPSNKSHPSANNLTIESVDFQDGGQYVCTVSNNVKTVNVTFNVKVQENIWPYIIGAIVGAAVLLLIGIAAVLNCKQNKMGEYQLKGNYR